MFTKIPLKGALEYDVFTGWRKVLCYTQKPGICKYVKRKHNKRFRQESKKDIREKLCQMEISN